MFVNLGFLKSKFSYLTISEYRQDGCLKISDFKHPTFVFDYRRILTSRIYKGWRKNIRDIQDIRVFDLPKMAVCFEKKFLFDPERKF